MEEKEEHRGNWNFPESGDTIERERENSIENRNFHRFICIVRELTNSLIQDVVVRGIWGRIVAMFDMRVVRSNDRELVWGGWRDFRMRQAIHSHGEWLVPIGLLEGTFPIHPGFPCQFRSWFQYGSGQKRWWAAKSAMYLQRLFELAKRVANDKTTIYHVQ